MAQYSAKTQAFWNKQVKEFEKRNPGINVDLEVVDWNSLSQQVPTWAQTHTLPDVLDFNTYSKFASGGLLHKASDITSPGLRKDVLKKFTKTTEVNGIPYAIPLLTSVRSIGYNKKIFSEIGAQPPKTWSEFVDVAERAEKAGYTGYCLPLGSEEAQAEWSMWMWSNGGGWKKNNKWAINSQQNVQTLQFLRNLANKYKVTEANPGKVNRTDGCWKSFSQGNVAMTTIMPTATFQKDAMGDSDVKWDSAPFPRKKKSSPESTLSGIDYLMSFKKPGNTRPVKKFLSFVYQKDRYLKFIRNEGVLPTTKSGSKIMATDPISGKGLDLLPKAKTYPMNDPAWDQVQKIVQSQLGTAMQGDTSGNGILDELQHVAKSSG